MAVTWVPWTHRRLRRASGYGAGVVSPGWYDHVFRHPGPEGVSRFFVDAARTLRAKGMPASPDHLIAASRVATRWPTLRDRPRPGLAEVLDAADCRPRRARGRARRAGHRRRHRRGARRGATGPAGPRPRRRPTRRPPEARAGAEDDRAATSARPTVGAVPTCCTASSPSTSRGASSRKGAARAGRSARPGVSPGIRSCPCASSSRPVTAPPSPPPRRQCSSNAPSSADAPARGHRDRRSWRCWPTCHKRSVRPCIDSGSWPPTRPTSPS